MTISDKVFRDERLVRKLMVVAEAERTGSTVVRALDDIAGTLCLCLVNGSARHLYGERHLQGSFLEGLLTQPGEHHTLLACPCPAPAAFVHERKMWWSHDPAAAWALQATEPSVGLGAQEWRWYRKPMGKSYYDAEWCAQVRPSAGSTHLAVRGLQGGIVDTSKIVGFAYFSGVAWAVQNALAPAPGGYDAPEVRDSAFGDIATEALRDESIFVPPRAPVDASGFLGPAFGSIAGDEVTVAPLAPKRQQLAQRAMPPAAYHLPVVAVLGDAGMLREPDVLVVTPTHAFIWWKGAMGNFAWSDLTGIGPVPELDSETVLLQTRHLGWIVVPAGGKAKAVREILAAYLATLPIESDDDDDADDDHDVDNDDDHDSDVDDDNGARS